MITDGVDDGGELTSGDLAVVEGFDDDFGGFGLFAEEADGGVAEVA